MISESTAFNKKNSRLAVALIIILTALVYANSLKNEFGRDDYILIVENKFIKSWKNLPLVFSKAYLPSAADINSGELLSGFSSCELTYRPVVTLSYFLAYSIWGLRPFGYHLMNLLFHIGNAVLLFILIRLLSKNEKIALLASLLFALHPVNTEVVNTISLRADLLSFFFFLSSFILYIKSFDNQRKKILPYASSLAMFLLALFSKEMAVTLPLMLIFYDLCFVFNERAVNVFMHFKSRYLSYIFALLFYFWIWGFVIGSSIIPPVQVDLTPYGALFTAIVIIAQYIKWIILPFGIYPILNTRNFLMATLTPQVAVSLLLILAFMVLAVIAHKRSRQVSFAMGWFFIIMLPFSNVFFLRVLMSLHYMYIPMAGFCLLFSVGLASLRRLKFLGKTTSILNPRTISAAVLICYTVITAGQNRIWRNEISVWSEMVRLNPFDAVANSGLGTAFLDKGLLDRAIVQFRKALQLAPDLLVANVSLGNALFGKGQYEEAIAYFQRAIEIDPQYMFAYHNLGVVYMRMRNFSEARKVWERALEVSPTCKIMNDDLEELKKQGL